jgi:nucleoside-diphosphate-sugar epimerase
VARDLGYAPRFSFEEGMRLTLEWYRGNLEGDKLHDGNRP